MDIGFEFGDPDLSLPHLILWYYLKSKMYARKFETIDELKNDPSAEVIAKTTKKLVKIKKNVAEELFLLRPTNAATTINKLQPFSLNSPN